MNELIVRQRWVPWWLGLGAAVLLVFFGFVIVRSLSVGDHGEEGIRVFIGFYVISAYLGLATILNVRMAEVTPEGVRVWVGPIPVGSSVSVSREEIDICYVRYYVGRHKGSVVDRFYTSGVQTKEGRQIDISGRIKHVDKATQTADKVSAVLNQGAGHYIQARSAPFNHRDRSQKRRVLAWLFVYLSAIIVGAYYEIQLTMR